MGTYDKKVNQLKDLMKRKYKSVYDKSKEIDMDISSMTYLPKPDVFDVCMLSICPLFLIGLIRS